MPKNIALIRIVTTVALTILLALRLKATIFCWPLVVIGVSFAAWTAYAHLLSKDPLIEVFYQIVGGKGAFEELPEIRLEQAANEKIRTAIGRLEWDQLAHPIYRTTTLDGRKVVIIKGRGLSHDILLNQGTKSTLAFIEKAGPEDLPREISNEPEWVTTILHFVFAPFQGNIFERQVFNYLTANGTITDTYETRICSSITTSMANQFFAQLTHQQ